MRRLALAFLAAAGVALGGTALGQLIVGSVRFRVAPETGAFVVLFFGWPFALAAALAVVPVYLVLARLGRASRRAALATGAAAGLVAGVLWINEPFMVAWMPLAGAAAGHAWWRVATGRP